MSIEYMLIMNTLIAFRVTNLMKTRVDLFLPDFLGFGTALKALWQVK